MPQNREIFLRHVEGFFGRPDLIKTHESPRGGAPVSVLVYKDLPGTGFITGITYGLSLYPHPDWTLSRPEMIIAVQSTDVMWAWTAAFLAAEFRGERRFC